MGTLRLVSFLISLILIGITIQIFFNVNHQSKSSSDAPHSPSPQNSTSVATSALDPSGSYLGSNYTSNSTVQQGQDITSLPTESLTFILLLMVLGLEGIFFWSRLSALYAFHRSRYLLTILSYSVNPDPESNISGSSLRRREYVPLGPIRLLEFFLALPPKALVPSLLPVTHLSVGSTTAEERRGGRRVTLLPEDQIIARDLKEGAAPLYNGAEMKGDRLVSQAPSAPSIGIISSATRNEPRSLAEQTPLPSSRPGSMSSIIGLSRISRRSSDTASLSTALGSDDVELPLSGRSPGGRATSFRPTLTAIEGSERVNLRE